MSQAIKKLINGYALFKQKYFGPGSKVYDELVLYGQRPKTIIISCSDSRVDPVIIFKCQPGELFVVRNVANLVPPFEAASDTYHGVSAALEFGVCFLEVEHIIILGHTQCGGIQMLLERANTVFDKKSHSFIAKWMELAHPAYDRVMQEDERQSFEDKVTLCEQYALINSLQNLKTFPWIQQRVAAGALQIHAWYFDLTTGIIRMYDQEKDDWKSL